MFEKFDFNQVPKISQFYLDDEGTMIVFDVKIDGDRYKGRFCKKGQELERFDGLTLQELQFMLNPTEEGEIKHQKFDTIKKIVKLNQPIYLYGPAGTGKNVICKQVADDLGIEFYFASSVTQEYKIVGYGDAKGEYVKTSFYDAFTKGGLFMLDEMDASSPEVLTLLNMAIANRYYDFPVVGRVNAHPDFRVIAAGNTCGRGADEIYSGRMQLDGATLNRFAYVEIDYDERIEMRMAKRNKHLVEFIQDIRKASKKAQMPMTLSYRNISMMADFIEMFEIQDALSMAIFKGMDKSDLSILYSNLALQENIYAKVMFKMINE